MFGPHSASSGVISPAIDRRTKSLPERLDECLFVRLGNVLPEGVEHDPGLLQGELTCLDGCP